MLARERTRVVLVDAYPDGSGSTANGTETTGLWLWQRGPTRVYRRP